MAAGGTVDENGILWRSTQVGSFADTDFGDGFGDNCYSMLVTAAEKYANIELSGTRPVLRKEMVNGFEKLVLGEYQWITYGTYFAKAEALGSGLMCLSTPLPKGSPVIIYADTQEAWLLCAFAAWRQGLVVGTIYSTLGEEGAEYGINLAKCAVVIADGKLLKVLAKVAPKCPSIKEVIIIHDEGMDKETASLKAGGITVTTMASLESMGKEKPCEPRPSAPKDTAVLMYTSGTTGNPKGVLISHAAIGSTCNATTRADSSLSWINGIPGQTIIAYLPLAHIMELVVELTCIKAGTRLGYGSPGTLIATSPKMLQTKPPQLGDITALKPDMFVAAPAVLDKIYTAVKAKFAAAPSLIKKLIDCGLASGYSNFDQGGVGASFPFGIFFKPVQKLLGGKVKIILTGSAPLGVEQQKFCQTVFNCPIRQGYGLTETCAASCIALRYDNVTQQCGPTQSSCCIKLRDWEEGNYKNSDKDDPAIGKRRGEILIGGPSVADGYLVDAKNPDPEVVAKNREEFVTIDGIRYFCTGDIGQFTEGGTIQIIDRKKDLVKLQHGEYVALSKVENACKSSKYVALPMVYGKSSSTYVIILICPVEPALKALASTLGVSGTIEELCKNAKVAEAVLSDVKKACKEMKLNKFETPEKVVLIPELWTPDNGMLTAVQKLKRKTISDAYAAEISTVYI